MVGHAIVRDEPTQVTAVIRKGCDNPAVEAFILTGGTGVTSRDSTFEAVEALLDKRLTGFGELFRMLSYQEVGAAAMLSRAQAGVVRGPRALLAARLAQCLPARAREADHPRARPRAPRGATVGEARIP